MTIASRLQHHLDSTGLPYGTVDHPYAATASECAQAAHVPGDHLAKSVLIHREAGPMLAVVPSNHQVDLRALQALLHNPLGLAAEEDMDAVFDDCAHGAAPCVGAAYGLPTIIDNSLSGLDTVWFEAGDHKTLVKMKGSDFDRLMRDASHEAICVH